MYIKPWASKPTWLERQIIRRFHKIYYDSGTAGKPWRHTFWFGRRLMKCPLDLWIYQEMLHELRPDYIIETGTWLGGSALYLAQLCDLLGQGKIVSIDIKPQPDLPEHPRVTFLRGSSVDPQIVAQTKALLAGAKTILVILDSDHARDHVLAELSVWSDVVTPGSYFIVEDSNVNGHPVFPKYGPGPMEAMDLFLAKDKRFVIDPDAGKTPPYDESEGLSEANRLIGPALFPSTQSYTFPGDLSAMGICYARERVDYHSRLQRRECYWRGSDIGSAILPERHCGL